MRFLCYTLLIVFTTSCGLIFEKNISGKSIYVYTPKDSLVTNVYSINFKWESVDDALNYNVQIVEGDFNNINKMLLDTLVSSTSFNYVLYPGEFTWRISAKNGGSQTDYQYRKLFVTYGSIEQQVVYPLSPKSNVTTKTGSLNVSWVDMPNAIRYFIEVDYVNSNFTSPIYQDTIYSPYTSTVVNLTSRGDLKWRIIGDSNGVNSIPSSPRIVNFIVDTCSLTYPNNLQTGLDPTINFTWKEPSNPLKIQSYNFYLYDSNKNVLSGYPINVNTTSTSISQLTRGSSYYWTVEAIDEDGIYSNKNSLRKFTVGI